MKHTLLLAIALVLAGCTTVKQAQNFGSNTVENGRKPIATVEIANSGWYLFGFIPLGSGDPAHPNDNSCKFFRNTLSVKNNLAMLEEAKKKAGATDIANLTTHWTDEAVFIILLKYRSLHTSAVLLKSEDPSL